MPTGYTADVQEGKVTEFPVFAMQCARAFGALILMRDDPADAPIPEEFKPSDFYQRSLETAQAELLELEAMAPNMAEVAARKEFDKAVDSWKERKEKRTVQKRRYDAMLAQVREYVPPSDEHVGFKDFMVKQLEESIDFDCNGKYDDPPKFKMGEDWRNERITELRRSIERYRQERDKEIERTNGRNRWVRQLRESLKVKVG